MDGKGLANIRGPDMQKQRMRVSLPRDLMELIENAEDVVIDSRHPVLSGTC
jgi:hypothetical protein